MYCVATGRQEARTPARPPYPTRLARHRLGRVEDVVAKLDRAHERAWQEAYGLLLGEPGRGGEGGGGIEVEVAGNTHSFAAQINSSLYYLYSEP